MSGLFDKIFKSSKDKRVVPSTSYHPPPDRFSYTTTPRLSTTSPYQIPHIFNPAPEISDTTERKEQYLERGVTALKFLKEVSEASGVLAPIKAICGATTMILETIQAMDSNNGAWISARDTIRRHQKTFIQLYKDLEGKRMDSEMDPSLKAIIDSYATELGRILGSLMLENEISEQNIPYGSKYDRLRRFMRRFGNVKMEAGRIGDYTRRLNESMNQFNTSTHLFTAVTVDAIDRKVDLVQQTTLEISSKLSDMQIGPVTSLSLGLKPRLSVAQNFVGRKEILEALYKTHVHSRSLRLGHPAITVLSGLGGSGKTQTALRFALDFEYGCPNAPVYFINADSEQTLKADLQAIIRSNGDRYKSGSHQDALIWLATKLTNFLLILDNADDPQLLLSPFIPSCSHGNVIITTRNSTLASISPDNNHHIEHLSPEDSITLLLNLAGYEGTRPNKLAARAIAQELGHLPLALAQAGGYIFVHKCLTTYLDMFRSSRASLLASPLSQRLDGYTSSVATVIQLATDRLPQSARDMMRLFAHLDFTSIPHSIIAKAAERRFEAVLWSKTNELSKETLKQAEVLRKIFCKGGEWSELNFNKFITQCLQYSLLRITTEGDNRFYSMHVLVQSYLRASATLIQGHRPAQLVVRLLGSSITIGERYQFLPFYRLLLPHIRLIRLEDVVEAGDHYDFGRVLDETGDGKLALAHQERCVEMCRASLREEHNATLAALSSLASSYKAVGRIQEAVEVQERVLGLERKQLGAEHPNTMIDMHNLADSYRKLGRKEEAMEMEEHVLKLRQKVLGPEDPLTLGTMNNLAVSYMGLGRAQDALKLSELVLEMRRKVLGPEHPDTIKSMYNLALSYYHFGRFEEVLELEGQVVELQMRVLGLEHPDTLSAIWNLACSLEDLGLKERRLDLLRIAVPAYEKVFGADHSDTIQLTSELKELLSELSQPADIALS